MSLPGRDFFRGSSASLDGLVHFDKAKADGFRFIFGVDEAGRGPLAGPVVAAAVCVREVSFIQKIADSKVLTASRRQLAFHEIFERSWVGVGLMSELVIDRVNILRASHLAMSHAVRDLTARMRGHVPSFAQAGQGSFVKVLIDGDSYSGSLPYQIETVVKGDAKSLSIACASIVAKVIRDRLMEKYDQVYPGYDFSRHKGYPTRAHCSAVNRLGFSPIHRRTFNCPV
jgi:ribonuclease HII